MSVVTTPLTTPYLNLINITTKATTTITTGLYWVAGGSALTLSGGDGKRGAVVPVRCRGRSDGDGRKGSGGEVKGLNEERCNDRGRAAMGSK